MPAPTRKELLGMALLGLSIAHMLCGYDESRKAILKETGEGFTFWELKKLLEDDKRT